ncbi:MAG: hypothetical protein J6U96_05515 [Elusimicrobiaceae bacterium]|nr:hypothetical protein [Elusimicrobiaceae bacterium]
MELLIVVIVLGILAGIAVPKYARVLENRKASEAEEILSAVRTEQEARCIAGKNYLGDKSKLTTLAGVGKSQNYSYELGPAWITAVRGDKYTLTMPYKSGTIYCSGKDCSSLNKDYPTLPDELEEDECAADVITVTKRDPKPTCGAMPGNIGAFTKCNVCGEKELLSYTCDEANGIWVPHWGECSVKNPTLQCRKTPFPCGIVTPQSKTEKCNGCGTRKTSYSCDEETGQWEESWSECSKTEEECKEPEETCEFGKWEEADGLGEDTCGGMEIPDCVEYKSCGGEGFPCGQEISRRQEKYKTACGPEGNSFETCDYKINKDSCIEMDFRGTADVDMYRAYHPTDTWHNSCGPRRIKQQIEEKPQCPAAEGVKWEGECVESYDVKGCAGKHHCTPTGKECYWLYDSGGRYQSGRGRYNSDKRIHIQQLGEESWNKQEAWEISNSCNRSCYCTETADVTITWAKSVEKTTYYKRVCKAKKKNPTPVRRY